MRLIKRLWLRFRVFDARVSLDEIDREQKIAPIPIKQYKRIRIYWRARIKLFGVMLKRQTKDTPDDDSEQLSKRAIPAPMYWHK